MKTSYGVLVVLLVCAFLISASALFKKEELSDTTVDSLKWWQETVVYQIYPRSYQDSDGDGIGDLKGIESRLDHLVEIGVEAIWLSPIYKSPMKDNGYDISDFIEIDPIFGTLSDFDDLMTAARSKGIKVILDFIPNHSSDLHEWFIKSVDMIEPYTNYYTWHDGKLDENGTRIPPSNWVGPFHTSMWEWNEKRQQYYLHQFAREQPDLRLENPLVEAEMLAALKFWLDRGVDGFRMDAVPHMFENQAFPDEPRDQNADPSIPPNEYQYWDHIHTFNLLPQTLEALRLYRVLLDIYEAEDSRPRVMMTEGYVPDYTLLMKYYGTPEEPIAHFPFNFDLVRIPGNITAELLKEKIDNWMINMPEGKWANWLVGNHDRPRVSDRFGKQLVDAANMVDLLLPGTAITYQGEEIGMENTFLTWEQTVDIKGCQAGPDRYHIYSRDPERTPMQWDATNNSGFSTADATWLPVNKNYESLNVANQNSLSESHLSVYRSLTALRKTDEWRFGNLEVKTLDGNVFGFTRILSNSGFLVLVNFGDSDLAADASGFTNVPIIATVYTRSVEYADNTVVIGAQVPTEAVQLPSKSSVVLEFVLS